MTERLSAATINALPKEVERFTYDRSTLSAGVVHLGLGAFHRAHQAMIFESAIEGGDPRWGIIGVSMRARDVRDRLKPQDGLYSVVVDQRARIVGALLDMLVAPEEPRAVVEALASPDVHLVTLTVTEKGYNLDPATGTLDFANQDVRWDIARSEVPRTVQGFLIEGLALRRERSLSPFTVISCDNLPRNGARLRDSVIALAEASDPGLARWIESECAFPDTMVDRIVPATTAADIDGLATKFGYRDEGMVATEPFLQWVIEDRFVSPHPNFASLGVNLTADVRPWEDAKLRLLNGAHSAMAYLGSLMGLEYVHEFVTRSDGRHFIESLWNEAATTLTPAPGLDIAAYRDQLMARFGNVSLRHRLRQIAIDGSQKLPQRLIATYAERSRLGLSSSAIALAIACWIRWQAGIDDLGRTHVVEDPLSETVAAALYGKANAHERTAAIFGMEALFPTSLQGDAQARNAVADALCALEGQGAKALLTRWKQPIL